MRLLLALTILASCAVVVVPAQASAGVFSPISPAPFGLRQTGLGAAEYARVAKLEAKYPRVGVGDVIAGANRTVRALGNSPALAGVPSVAGGFHWQSGDDTVDYWYPQGITGSADAVAGGVVDGHRELLVSWYSKNGKGVRLSFVNADRLESATYRHVLLVTPGENGTFTPVDSHAGGIAWVGDYLYVAETHGGLRVFDMRHLERVPDPADAEGYAFILPQVGTFATTAPDLVFSFVSVDRAASALITGEYRDGQAGGRIVRWPLDLATGLVKAGTASAAFTSPATNVQGALELNGRLGTSSSAGAGNGTLTSGTPGQTAAGHPWAVGAEDLSYAPTSGRVYSLTEHPGARVVFAVPASSVGL